MTDREQIMQVFQDFEDGGLVSKDIRKVRRCVGGRVFEKKKVKRQESFDREREVPVIKSSICTGEQVAGFKELKTGHFREIMCIRTQEDREGFLEEYGIEPEEIRKEW